MFESSFSVRSSKSFAEALGRAVALWGVEPEFWDIWGQLHAVPPDTQIRILAALGVCTDSPKRLDAAVEKRLWSDWARLTPPTLVVSESARRMPIRVDTSDAGAICHAAIRLEDGGGMQWEARLAAAVPEKGLEIRGKSFLEMTIRLPGALPLGYHELDVRLSTGPVSRTHLIVAPDRVYRPPALGEEDRAAGIAVALYGLRSNRNWGCGDFTDLRGFVDWAAEATGAAFIAINPLHAIANRQPYNTSPYLPACVLYRNHIYLDIENIPDFAAAGGERVAADPGIQEEIRALRESEFVEYERVAALKTRFLRLCFRSFLHREFRTGSPRALEFQRFVELEGKPLDQYAVWSVLDQQIHRRHPDVWIWRDWPIEHQNPDSAATRQFAADRWRAVLFHKYVQWQIDVQIAAVQQHAAHKGMPIGLYHDLALATDPSGCDTWSNRDFYVPGCRVGVPPDDFSPNGQDWGFLPPNSERHHEDGYQLFREWIRKSARHGGALRIDHVMRFFHLYWIPDGQTAGHGAYVMDRYEDLIRVLALESVRGKFMVIGEDLGTVADFIRESLAKFGVSSYRLFYFERRRDGSLIPPGEYPRRALVSVSTHDLPTLAGFWTGHDIEVRWRLGLIPTEESYHRQHAVRRAERQRILAALHSLNLLPDWFPRAASDVPELSGELHSAIIGFLASTPSELLAVNQEDLFKQPHQQNLPGTISQYPNWRNKMRFGVDELWDVPYVRDCAAMLRGWLLKTGRAV